MKNTPQKCAEEVMEMFCDAEVDVLLSCGGGELMCEILSYVDFEALSKAKPKWFMGYSDNTNLTYLLATLADTASIYGPCAATFGMEPWHESILDAWKLLCGEKHTMTGYPLWEKEWLKDENGEPAPVYSVASGLDYPSCGPEHAFLHDLGRVKYDVVTDDETIDAFFELSRMEGIIPAIESSHAVAYGMKLAKTMGKGSILINLSGRGDKDMDYIIEKYGIR